MGHTPDRPDYSEAGAAAVELSIPADCAGLRLDQALARVLPEHSRARLQAWIRAGRVTVDGRTTEAKARVWAGESVRVEPAADPAAAPFVAQPIALAVVYEDDAVIIVDKPPGLVVHPGSGNWTGTLANALLHHCPALAAVPRAGIVHRLDKDTSGLLVVAKTVTAQTHLVRQLQARSVKREYLAVVHGRVARGGKVVAAIGRHPSQRTRMAVVSGGKEAVTHYEVRERYAHATLLACRLETGRTHQIRVHMHSIGHPLAGDPTYGRRSAPPGPLAEFRRQALHAERLTLVHPVTGQTMSWHAPLPADLRALLAALATTAQPLVEP